MARWRLFADAKNLLIRLNGFDLGYIDASLGDFEIRDIDDSEELRLELAWMDENGELSDVALANVLDKEPLQAPSISEVNNIEPILPVISSTDGEHEGSAPDESAAISPLKSPIIGSVFNRTYDGSKNTAEERPMIRAPTGFSHTKISDFLKIILSVFGAIGLLLLLVFRRRHGN